MLGLAAFDAWPVFTAVLVLSGTVAGYFRPAIAAALFIATYPALDFTPWAGQGVLRHHDFLAVGICCGWYWSRIGSDALPTARRAVCSWPVLYVAWVTVTAAIGYLWLQDHAPPGAVVHLSPGNALRVAKGAWLALLVVWSYPRPRAGGPWPQVLVDMSRGVPWALIYMGLWYGLERLLFIGWGDWDRYFRIGGPMSGAANLGGQSSEAVLLVLMAWSILAWQTSPRWWWRAIVAFGLVCGSLSLVLSQTRSALLIALVAAALLVFVGILARRSSHQRLRWSLAGGALLALCAAVVVSIPALRTRFAELPADWQMRRVHYETALGFVAEHPQAWWFGMGSGTFPTAFATRGPLDQHPGWFGIAPDHGTSALVVQGGQPGYLGWNVDRSLRAATMVRLHVRSPNPSDFGVHLCEKNLMHSVACRSARVMTCGSPNWHWQERTLSGDPLGTSRWQSGSVVRPLFLSIGTPVGGQRLQVASIELLSAEGSVLWRRDRFEAGFPGALQTTDYYWPFHVENDALHLIIEQGAVGFLLLLASVLQAAWYALRPGVRWGVATFAIVLAGLAAGIVNSPLDTPESAALWLVSVFALARHGAGAKEG